MVAQKRAAACRAVDAHNGGVEAQNGAVKGLQASGRRFAYILWGAGSGSASKWTVGSGSVSYFFRIRITGNMYGTRIFPAHHTELSGLFSRKFDICRAGASCRGFDETEYQNGEHKTRYQCTVLYCTPWLNSYGTYLPVYWFITYSKVVHATSTQSKAPCSVSKLFLTDFCVCAKYAFLYSSNCYKLCIVIWTFIWTCHSKKLFTVNTSGQCCGSVTLWYGSRSGSTSLPTKYCTVP